MALTRNMAIACRERMKFVDVYIPIHFGKENRLSRNTTSAIFISIKDREKFMEYKNGHVDVDKMNFFLQIKPNKDQSSTSFCSLAFKQRDAMYLSSVQKHNKPLPYSETKVPQTPTGVPMLRAENSDRLNTRTEGTTQGPACYTINAKGYSSNI